ncbi:MAG: peptidyl-prolyl cis-trans isomerase [Vicinamibacterales bacterium]
MHSKTATRTWAAITLALLVGVAEPASSQVIEQVLVNVNGEILTKTGLEERQVQAIRQRQLNPTTDQQLRQMLDELTPELIVSIVDEMLMVQHGRDLGYRLADDQFQQVLGSIKTDNNFQTDEDLHAALKQENMTLDDLRNNLERSMIVQRVQQNEILGRVAVSEEEARRYYDSHLNEFTSPATVTLREVFINYPAGVTVAPNSAADLEARARADDVRRRALAGESFETLASQVSESASKANGGLIGPLSVDEVVADLRTLLDRMNVGDISEPIRTPRGYQVLKLESSSPQQTLPFPEAQQQISDRVFTDKRQAELRRYLSTLRSEAVIDWKSAELERAFKQGLEKLAAPAGN